jgi:hypothetical protein
MGRSEDLLERYHSFHLLVEAALTEAFGQCHVSYWCPDDENKHLIECVIRGRNETRIRRPSQVDLDPGPVQHCLETGRPWLATPGDRIDSEASISCDACLPLYRPHGQPLLVLLHDLRMPAGPDRTERFIVAVQLIKFFWEQLQAINQRQWLAEHDAASRALRAATFLEEGQSWAQQLHEHDEPFAVIVLTIRGFRSMFARNARQWRQLAGIVGQGLDSVMRRTGKRFLLGKTADDVFVLLLGDADAFLAGAAMESLVARLESQIRQDRLARTLDVLAVELRWSISDHQEYSSSLERLLNRVYARLFAKGDVEPCGAQIVIAREPAGVSLQEDPPCS